jgi:hypothetical protein
MTSWNALCEDTIRHVLVGPWDEEATKEAAANGHLEYLKYLHENGCPWDKVPIERKVKVWWKMVQDMIRTKYIG